jgi:hypothetical protein
LNRRDFIRGTAGLVAGTAILGGCSTIWPRRGPVVEPVALSGPGAMYRPAVRTAFVRRKEEYGMWWPGAVYDGEAARRMYTRKLEETARSLGVKLDIRPTPIHSPAEADAWVKDAQESHADGLLVVLLDRQQHAWPTARKAAGSGIPTVVFSPVGSSFTTNTVGLAETPGCVIYSTDDFSQPAYGLKMLQAGAKMRHARCIVIKGGQRAERSVEHLGVHLQYVPAQTFLDTYQSLAVEDRIAAVAEDCMRRARRQRGASREDVINGARGYFTARRILEKEKGDAITMDCLGALADRKESLPCLAWSLLNDARVPAACEADIGAVAGHILVQYLFDRPGFQQDPVAETARDAVIGAHCVCATRLHGFDAPPEPFDIVHHHGNRDATVRTIWKEGQRVTCLDVLPGKGDQPTELLISAGSVLENVRVPPAGGCVVSVMVKFDGGQEVLTFPGFHQLFFYGDYKRELVDFCRLYELKATVV